MSQILKNQSQQPFGSSVRGELFPVKPEHATAVQYIKEGSTTLKQSHCAMSKEDYKISHKTLTGKKA